MILLRFIQYKTSSPIKDGVYLYFRKDRADNNILLWWASNKGDTIPLNYTITIKKFNTFNVLYCRNTDDSRAIGLVIDKDTGVLMKTFHKSTNNFFDLVGTDYDCIIDTENMTITFKIKGWWNKIKKLISKILF